VSKTVFNPSVYVDGCGNIHIDGRSDVNMLCGFNDGSTSDPSIPNRLVSSLNLIFEVAGIMRVPFAPGDDAFTRRLILDDAQVRALPLVNDDTPQFGGPPTPEPALFVVRDETLPQAQVLWYGQVSTFGFNTQPPNGPS
jgi:hypothetical protein